MCSICCRKDEYGEHTGILGEHVDLVKHMYSIDVSSTDSLCAKCWNVLVDLRDQHAKVESVRLDGVPADDATCSVCRKVPCDNRYRNIPHGFVDLIKHMYNIDLSTTDLLCTSCWNVLVDLSARRLQIIRLQKASNESQISNQPNEDQQNRDIHPAKIRRTHSPLDGRVVTPPLNIAPPTPRGPKDYTSSDSGSTMYPPTTPHTPSSPMYVKSKKKTLYIKSLLNRLKTCSK